VKSEKSKEIKIKNYLINKSRTPVNERRVPNTERHETRSPKKIPTSGMRRTGTSDMSDEATPTFV